MKLHRIICILLALLMITAALCACAPSDPGNKDTRPDHSAEAGKALSLAREALKDNRFVMDKTTAFSEVHVVSEQNSLMICSELKDEGRSDVLYHYQDTRVCYMYTYEEKDGFWKKYETSTAEHNWNVTRPKASYFPILETIVTCLRDDGILADDRGYFTLPLTDGDVTMWVENNAIHTEGEVGLFSGSTVIYDCGTATITLTDDMLNAEQYPYVHSQK